MLERGAEGFETPNEWAELMPRDLERFFSAYNPINQQADDPLVIAKYYLPGSSVRWYVTEYADGVFKGFITGFLYPKWEEFTAEEWSRLEESCGKNVTRDEEFQPEPFSL